MTKKADKKESRRTPRPRTPYIRQRTSEDPISITNLFADSHIELQIKASKEDLKLLMNRYLLVGAERFGHEFYSSFLSLLTEKLCKSEGQLEFVLSTGSKIRIEPGAWTDPKRFTIENTKIMSGVFYLFFSSCVKERHWPEYLGFLQKLATYDSNMKNKKGEFIPEELTAKCVADIYNAHLERHNLHPFEDIANFRKTYIMPGTKIIKNDPESFMRFAVTLLMTMHPGFMTSESNFYPLIKSFIALCEGIKSDVTTSILSILKKQIPYL